MNVYMLLPTVHMDELKLAKLKKALKRYRTQPVIQSGLEFWLGRDDADANVPGIAALCRTREEFSALLDVCRDARISPHIGLASESHPAKYFVVVRAREAYDAMDESAQG
ncbi:MAG: hypothetical protein K2X29_12485 [Candidatus Obscuribacterales bacterium]|nr:hypothetical protein [Candidatus Obscuribacterales bacterium]